MKTIYIAKAVRLVAAVMIFFGFLGMCDETLMTTSMTVAKKVLSMTGFFAGVSLYKNADQLVELIFGQGNKYE